MSTHGARTAVRLGTWLLPLLTLGCMMRVESCGGSWHSIGDHSVTERDGKLVVDGVRLDHERWVDVVLEADGLEQLAVETATGPVELRGGAPGSCTLSVRVHSSLADDGEVFIADGKLGVRSQQEGTVFINGVRGEVPPQMALVIGTGTGDVLVEQAAKDRSLSIDTGTGTIIVRNSEPASVDVAAGSADVRLEQGGSASVKVEVGAGDVRIVDGRWGKIVVDGGTTDLELKGAQAESVSLDSGTGDLQLQGCTVESAKLDSGTGDLVISGGSCKQARIDSGTGDIEVRDGAQVGSQSSN